MCEEKKSTTENPCEDDPSEEDILPIKTKALPYLRYFTKVFPIFVGKHSFYFSINPYMTFLIQ